MVDRELNGDPPITTWNGLKELLKRRFFPMDYTQQVFILLERLKQGVRTSEEYYKELRSLLQRTGMRHSEAYIIAKFIGGLYYEVTESVEQI